MNNWYALYIKPRWEKKVALKMEEEGFLIYCPLAKRTRQWSDRVRIVEEPVFKGYIFIYCTLNQLWKSLQINGVIYPVRYLGKPAVIRDEEIQAIRKFLNEFDDFEVENITLEKDDKVIVKQGVMMDYQGIILEVHGKMAVVKIRSLGLQLRTIIGKKNLEKLN